MSDTISPVDEEQLLYSSCHAEELDEAERWQRFDRVARSHYLELVEEHGPFSAEDISQLATDAQLGDCAKEMLDQVTLDDDEHEQATLLFDQGESAKLQLETLFMVRVVGLSRQCYEVAEDQLARPASVWRTVQTAKSAVLDILDEPDSIETSDPLGSIELQAEDRTLDWLTARVRHPKKYEPKLLSDEEKNELFAQYQAGDKEARSKLLEAHSRLFRFIIVRDWIKTGKVPSVLDGEDLVDEAVVYAAKRLETFNAERGKMSTHFTHYLQHHLSKRRAELADPVHIPVHVYDYMASERVPDDTITLEEYYRRESVIPEQGRPKLNAGFENAWPWMFYNLVHLEDGTLADTDQFATDPEGPSEFEIGFEELLGPEHYLTEEDKGKSSGGITGPNTSTDYDPEAYAVQKLFEDNIADALDELDAREALVIEERFGMGGDGRPKTLEEVGRMVGVTGQRVRQIEAKAFTKLRHPHLANNLRDDMYPHEHRYYYDTYHDQIDAVVRRRGLETKVRNLADGYIDTVDDSANSLAEFRDLMSDIIAYRNLYGLEAVSLRVAAIRALPPDRVQQHVEELSVDEPEDPDENIIADIAERFSRSIRPENISELLRILDGINDVAAYSTFRDIHRELKAGFTAK